MGHANPKLGHTFSTICYKRKNNVENEMWRSREASNFPVISQSNQRITWDTGDAYGPIRVNGLPVGLGHTFEVSPKKKPGAAATASGFDLTTSQKNVFPVYIAEIERRHPIIAQHWGISQ